jgi:hypothetical protein
MRHWLVVQGTSYLNPTRQITLEEANKVTKLSLGHSIKGIQDALYEIDDWQKIKKKEGDGSTLSEFCRY